MKKFIFLFTLLLLVGCNKKVDKNFENICVEPSNNQFLIIHSTSSCAEINGGVAYIGIADIDTNSILYCPKCTDEEWCRLFIMKLIEEKNKKALREMTTEDIKIDTISGN